MILNDIQDIVEKNMSESQVGARRNKSIRNHLFVIYSIMNSVNQKESPPVDIALYDVKKCFDALWLQQCCNYLFEAGVKDDKLSMVFRGNQLNKISVLSPAGPTEMSDIEECVSQGSGLGPTLCAVSVDIGKDTLNRKEELSENNDDSRKHVFLYKNKVEVASMCMVDDVAHAQECGTKSVEDNAQIAVSYTHLTLPTKA